MAIQASDINQDILTKFETGKTQPTHIEQKASAETLAGVENALAKLGVKKIKIDNLPLYADAGNIETDALSEEQLQKAYRDMEKVLEEFVTDEGEHEYENMLEDIQKRKAEKELFRLFLEFQDMRSSQGLGDDLSSEYLYAIMLGVSAKANAIDYGGKEAMEALSQIVSEGYVTIDTKSEISQLIDFFRQNYKEIEKLSNMNKLQLEQKLEEMDKNLAEADKKLAEADKNLAEADKKLTETDKKLTEMKKHTAEIDREAADLKRLKEKLGIIINLLEIRAKK